MPEGGTYENVDGNHKKGQLCRPDITIGRQPRHWFSDLGVTPFAGSSDAEDAGD